MSTVLLKDTDLRLRDAVMRQLEWDPEVDASAIGTAARDGVVTLTGYIGTYPGKLAAERAAKRVRGVRGVDNELQVRLRLGRTDEEIAQDAVLALELRPSVPANVQAVVHDGHVTLTGTATWLFQRDDAENAVRHVKGVRGVNNHIKASPPPAMKDVQRHIVAALHRTADVDARQISVMVSGGKAVLKGHVSSWAQWEAAERAARSAPGITAVDNLLEVDALPLSLDFDDIC